MIFLKTFKDILEKGAISTSQHDKFGRLLRQFDEIEYEGEIYLIVWHPIIHEFIGSHESKYWISHTDFHKSVWRKNLKNGLVTKK